MELSGSKSVTRLLQHSILQLCNEHIIYSNTLQVLGVICLTIDDKQQEIVIKVNNTLKRVNPLTPPKESSPTTPLIKPVAGTAPARGDLVVSDSSNQSGVLLGSACGDPEELSDRLSLDDEPGENPIAETPTEEIPKIFQNYRTDASLTLSEGRRQHGRKQTKPVRVQNTEGLASGNNVNDKLNDVDDDDDDEVKSSLFIDEQVDNDASHDVVNSPREEMSNSSVVSSPAVLRLKPNNGTDFTVTGSRRKLENSLSDAELVNEGSSFSAVDQCVGEKMDIEDQAGESAEASLGIKLEVNEDDLQDLSLSIAQEQNERVVNFSHLRPPPLVMAPGASLASCPEDLSIKSEKIYESPQESALNFSLGALGHKTTPPPLRRNGKTLENNTKFTKIVPSTSTDQNALLATFSAYPNFEYLLGNAQASGSINAATLGQNMSLLGAINNSFTYSAIPTSIADLSKPKPNGKTLLDKKANSSAKRLAAAVAKRHRDRMRGLAPILPATAKVKDIIMYDDSAPLHDQRGSKVEGDYLLDSLSRGSLDGKKRRRRATEESLTAEEIAEYIGISGDGATPVCCRVCNYLSPDVTTYFSHCLTQHGAYICHQCERSFTTKSSLLRHRPIHTGMRRFTCGICRKAFYRKDKCKAHIKRHLGLINVTGTGTGTSTTSTGTLDTLESTVVRPETLASALTLAGGTITVGVPAIYLQPAHTH